MSFGFAIRQTNGRLWCSPDVTPLIFHKKITLKGAVKILTTDIPSDQPIMIFYRSAGSGTERAVLFNKVSPVGGFHYYNIQDFKHEYQSGNNNFSVGFDVYIFTKAYSSKKLNYGLNIYDNVGRLVYSAGMKPLEIKYKRRYSMNLVYYHTGEYRFNFAKKIAVLPTYVNLSSQEWYYSDHTEFSTDFWVSRVYSDSWYGEDIIYNKESDKSYGYSYDLDSVAYIETDIYDK